MNILGFDIGGTKCAVTAAQWDGNSIKRQKNSCPTLLSISPSAIIEKLNDIGDSIAPDKPNAIGISCGRPLNSETGIILGTPNLPSWDHVEIVKQLHSHYGVPVKLQKDANVCAVAEWKFGAGRGCRNMVFLTFETGLGVGLILDGKLYCDTNDNAGEVGHAQLGYFKALEKVQMGICPLYYKEGMSANAASAKSIAEAAATGDKTALEIYRICGTYLGKGLAIIIDFLNPELTVIGSMFARSKALLWETAKKEIETEALKFPADV